jgi:hypothetical protein
MGREKNRVNMKDKMIMAMGKKKIDNLVEK